MYLSPLALAVVVLLILALAVWTAVGVKHLIGPAIFVGHEERLLDQHGVEMTLLDYAVDGRTDRAVLYREEVARFREYLREVGR